MKKTVIIYILWLAKPDSIGLLLFQLYLELSWPLACRGVKAPISDQGWITKFHVGGFFQYMNFFSSSYELNIVFTVNWNKLNFNNFINEQNYNYEPFRKNYGYLVESNIVVKIIILQFSSMTFNIISRFYILISRPAISTYEPHKLSEIKNGSLFFSVFITTSERFFNNLDNERACSDIVLHLKTRRFSDESLVDSSCGCVEKVFKTLVRQSPPGSNERVQGSPDAQSPLYERLFYFPDEKTRVSPMTQVKNTGAFISNSSEDLHPFQRIDTNGVPKRFDILDTFSKFLSMFDDSKVFTKAPNLITEEVNVAFTVFINWLNHARLVNFTHVF
jgi:hypothetical protein